MPATHRPPPLQPAQRKNQPKLRSLPTPLRIDATTSPYNPAVTLVFEETPSSALSDQSEADSFVPPKPKSLRNQKKLSLTLPSAHSNTSSSSLSFQDSPTSMNQPSIQPPPLPASRRRPSVISLPNASATNILHRRDEEVSPSAPYLDGPIQVLPGIWIGSEDNARDWKGLIERGIKSILNVAKEVASPYASAADASLRPTVSTPNLTLAFSEAKSDPTYVPPHGPSGRPAMHYLRLPWSHGQADLVGVGFVDGMAFVDEALERGDGVLIHCQCGVSRSATMVIALVMRAAHSESPSMPPEVLALKSGGMHAAYAFVKGKSKWVGPNMSLMYQLLEYERTLSAGNRSPTPSDRSSQNADELEWSRQRQELDETSPDEDERESVELLREARALDLEMEQRMAARKTSQHSRTGSIGSTVSGIGMGTAWKSRYGHSGRSRAGSVASNFTNHSVLSEDLLEEDEDNIGCMIDISAGFSSGATSTETTEEEARAPSCSRQYNFTPTTARPPPSAPVIKRSFGDLPLSSAHHMKPSLENTLRPLPSAPAAKQSFSVFAPSNKFKKHRPPPLLPPVPPSPVGVKIPEAEPQPKFSRRMPAPLYIPAAPSRRSSTSSTAPAPTPSQTLFVFPPEPSIGTPLTMTLTTNTSGMPFPSVSTPRVSTFKKEGRRRSLITLGGAPPTPTTACSRVDARGFVAMNL